MNIINGKILTMAGKIFENGFIITKDGKIEEIGDMKDFNMCDSECFDANGNYVLPGFIDAHCHIGIWEDSLGFEGDDGNEDTDPITPQLRAIDAINPLDRTFKEALLGGITTVVTGPGSSNPIAGQFTAIKTFGKRIDDMIVKEVVAIKMALGENPKSVYHEKHQSPVTRMATAALIRETLSKAKNYKEEWDKYNKNPIDEDRPSFDMKMESLLPLIEKKIFAKIHAHRADDIFTAIRIAREFDIDITIEHVTDGALIADILEDEKIPLNVGPIICDRSKPELKNLSPKTPSILEKHGIDISIITDHPVIPIQYLSLCAAVAVKEGLGVMKALETITINAARNCRISDRVGSLEVGKDADIVIFDSLPVENIMAELKAVFVNGVKIEI